MKRIAVAVLAASCLIACDTKGPQAPAADAAPAAAVDKKAAAAAEVRQSVLKLVRTNFVPLVGMMRGDIPYNNEAAAKHALRITQLMRMMPDAFETDTRGSGVQTEALDRIWEDKASFNDKLHNALLAADDLLEKTKGGDEGVVKTAIGALGKTCGGCHDDFREDKD